MKERVIQLGEYFGMSPEYTAAIEDDFDWFERFGINTEKRWAHFLAQCAHESGGFSLFEENLNYRPKTLMRVWPRRFPTLGVAKRYGIASGMSVVEKYDRNVALANKVYGGRMGNDRPSDGWRYRGRGPIQLTGCSNYTAAGARLGLDLVGDPDMVCEDPFTGLAVAAWFFCTRTYKGKTCAQWADSNSVAYVTRAINGGKHGLADRQNKTSKAIAILQSGNTLEIPTNLPLVRKGSKCTAVKYLQRCLVDMGYAKFSPTNYFGAKTAKAVIAFQRDNGLKPDAIVGKSTWACLQVRHELHCELNKAA